MRRNFTTFIIEWKKKHKLGRLLNENWQNHYCALVAKFIQAKHSDKNYFKVHMKNSVEHMLG